MLVILLPALVIVNASTWALRTALDDIRIQILSGEELHHEPWRVGLFVHAGGDDLDDVLALDERAHLRFLREAAAGLLVVAGALQHQLERALFARADLLDHEERAHPAFGQGLDDAEIPLEHVARFQGQHRRTDYRKCPIDRLPDCRESGKRLKGGNHGYP